VLKVIVGRRVWLCAVVALAAMAMASPARAVVYESEPASCEQTVVHDYLTALDRLPAVEPLPDDRVAFTSARIYLKPTEQLIVGRGTIGFSLYRPVKAPVIHPRWSVVSTLSRINWRGFEVEHVETKRRKVPSLGRGRGAGARFEVPPKSGPYRLIVRFRSPSGRTLAQHHFYFRVVPATTDVRLVLDASAYRAGETVFAQLQNFGTTRFDYGLGFWVEQLAGSGWVEAPENPRNPVPAIALLLGPGRASSCTGFWVPPTMDPGRYRISRGSLSTEFDVVG
jgi:hypothetical protein